MTVYNLTTGCI